MSGCEWGFPHPTWTPDYDLLKGKPLLLYPFRGVVPVGKDPRTFWYKELTLRLGVLLRGLH